MNIRQARSFSTELAKIAAGILDPDIRALVADRNGKEYLQGGQLATNDTKETNFTPKLAGWNPFKKKTVLERAGEGAKKALKWGARFGVPAAAVGAGYHIGKKTGQKATDKMKMAGFGSYTPPSAYNFRGKDPTGKGSSYETASNLASSALKGGMTGAGAATLGHSIAGKTITPKHLGIATAIGAGVGLGDRYLRHHAAKKALEKKANFNSGTFSPARQLSEGRSVRSFENKIHAPAGAGKAAGLMGKDFRLPK